MPTFVWQRGGRGDWAPSLFWGDMPREMTASENRGLYVFHPIPEPMATQLLDVTGGTLEFLSREFPAPAPEPEEILHHAV